MNDKQIKKILSGTGHKERLFLTFAPILLIVFLAALIIMMVSACFKFTKGPLSTTAFLKQLQLLQARFAAGKMINPETEREEMERLQNKIKTFSEASVISANADLKQLLYSICKSIQTVLGEPGLENRTSWIKLNAMMVDFNRQYFRENT